MPRLLPATSFSIFLFFLLGGALVSAQSSGTLVQFGALPGVQTIAGAPGSTVNIPVSIIGTSGIIPRVDVEIHIPSPLRVLDTSYCSAETVKAVQGAAVAYKPCQIVGRINSDDTQLVSARIDGLGTLEGFRIKATLLVAIPSFAPIGSEYRISALNYDFFRSPAQIIVAVMAEAPTEIPPSISSTSEISPAGPLNDIDGSAVDFLVGSIRPISFEISYDAYPEATSASLTLYASTGSIDVADPSVIDWDASFTCGPSGAATSRSLAKPKRPVAALPTFFNLSLPRWLEPGTEVRVCAEVVYYNGSAVVSVERYMSVVTFRE